MLVRVESESNFELYTLAFIVGLLVGMILISAVDNIGYRLLYDDLRKEREMSAVLKKALDEYEREIIDSERRN